MSEDFDRLQSIFRDVFDNPQLTISAESSAQNIEDWDSLAHINLVSAIEQEFGIQFSLGELESLKNVGEMMELMRKKNADGGRMNAYVWEDLRVGLAAEFTATITEQMMGSFLFNYGDDNPMHLDASYAKQKGYAGPLVYGLLTSSFYSTLVGVYLPGKYALLHGIDISFVEPAYAGDQIMVRGAIDYLNVSCKQAQIRAAITNRLGKVVSKAKIKAGVLAP